MSGLNHHRVGSTCSWLEATLLRHRGVGHCVVKLRESSTTTRALFQTGSLMCVLIIL